MTKKYFTIFLILLGITTVLGFQLDPNTQKDCEIFTIYLVRHSEKDLDSNNGGNPPLTPCGAQRSEHLNSFLNDVHLDAVYSTDYTRTKNTALPTARSKGLEVQEYAAHDLEAILELLINRKQNALVVGHSNTTGVLSGLLVGEELGGIDLDTYNRIYQVVIHKKSSRLHLFHSAFNCTD
ncbi:MAG: broad specificity phosphatase PhoE [Bacteroidia bacterium]|jgi:broad specificity phosphatase PhoE